MKSTRALTPIATHIHTSTENPIRQKQNSLSLTHTLGDAGQSSGAGGGESDMGPTSGKEGQRDNFPTSHNNIIAAAPPSFC